MDEIRSHHGPGWLWLKPIYNGINYRFQLAQLVQDGVHQEYDHMITICLTDLIPHFEKDTCNSGAISNQSPGPGDKRQK